MAEFSSADFRRYQTSSGFLGFFFAIPQEPSPRLHPAGWIRRLVVNRKHMWPILPLLQGIFKPVGLGAADQVAMRTVQDGRKGAKGIDPLEFPYTNFIVGVGFQVLVETLA